MRPKCFENRFERHCYCWKLKVGGSVSHIMRYVHREQLKIMLYHQEKVLHCRSNYLINHLCKLRTTYNRSLWNSSMNIAPWEVLTIKPKTCFLYLKKSDKMWINSPEMPFCFNLKISTLCQALSKAVDMSKKTLVTSNPLLNDVKVSWVIDSSRLIQASTGWKPDWFYERWVC